MWCIELIQLILFVACSVGLIVLWRDWHGTWRAWELACQEREEARDERNKACNDRDDLAADLEWLWEQFTKGRDNCWMLDKDKRRRALKVSIFVRHRKASRNMAWGLAAALRPTDPAWPWPTAGLRGPMLGGLSNAQLL